MKGVKPKGFGYRLCEHQLTFVEEQLHTWHRSGCDEIEFGLPGGIKDFKKCTTSHTAKLFYFKPVFRTKVPNTLSQSSLTS